MLRLLKNARARPPLVAAVIAAVAALGATTADAQTVFFSGYTNGCFGCGTPTQDAGLQDASVGNLTFENALFEGSTVDGFLGIGSNANAAGVQDLQNFGGLYLGSGAFNYNGQAFSLLVSLIEPGTHSELYTIALSGRISATAGGGVKFDFDNNLRAFTIDDRGYRMYVDDVTVFDGEDAPITGGFYATPEPVSLALMGTGLLGLAVVRRRRRKHDEVEESV